MKDIIKWFENEKEFGCIEYKGKNVYIYYSIFNEKENKDEYFKIKKR